MVPFELVPADDVWTDCFALVISAVLRCQSFQIHDKEKWDKMKPQDKKKEQMDERFSAWIAFKKEKGE